MALSPATKVSLVAAIGAVVLVLGGVLHSQMPAIFESVIAKKIGLSPGSDLYDKWVSPPVPVYLQIWVWNCTNSEEWLEWVNDPNVTETDTPVKPRFQQLGPYTYREYKEKRNLVWDDGADTVTYDQFKKFEFLPEKSDGAMDDEIVVPNIPLMTITSLANETDLMVLNLAMVWLKPEVFVKTTIGEYLFDGYYDKFVAYVMELAQEEILPNATFSLFQGQNDSSDGRYTIFRGNHHVQDFAKIHSWNNMTKLPFWTGDTCNMINGTDANQFPPGLSKLDSLYLFNTDLCRSVHIQYSKEVVHEGILTYRYEAAKDMAGDYNMNPNNHCFCVPHGYCQGAGLLNLASCKKNAPIYMSGAHFLQTAYVYIEAVEGMRPDPNGHATIMDIEPRTGSVLHAARRVQMNLHITPRKGIDLYQNMPDIFLPLIWVNETAMVDAETADEFRSMVETPMKIGSVFPIVLIVLGGITTFFALAYVFFMLFKLQSLTSPSMYNLHRNGDASKTGFNNPDFKSAS